jgi:hypothetical protein
MRTRRMCYGSTISHGIGPNSNAHLQVRCLVASLCISQQRTGRLQQPWQLAAAEPCL